MADPIFPDLHPLLEPSSIAVVGASENRGPGRQVLENLAQLGYRGSVYPVNPKYKAVLELPCYPSLRSVYEERGPLDMLAILLGRDSVLPVLEEAAQVGVKAAWAFASGFAEAGTSGKELQGKLLSLCKERNILFCGPNCVGYLNPAKHVGTYSAPAPKEILYGGLGFVAQSGYVCLAMANSGRKIGFSTICSSGNEAVLDATDYMAYLIRQEETKVIGGFIEQFRSPQKLIQVASLARDQGKPLILIKVGKSALAKRATEAHTGALAGADDVQDALFDTLGIIRVHDLEELFETAELLIKYPNPPASGRRAFAFTLSGGIIGLFGDLVEPTGIELPDWSAKGREEVQTHLPPYATVSNPLDAWGYGKIEQTYPVFLRTAAQEDADFLLVLQDLPPNMAAPQVEQYMVPVRAAIEVHRSFGKPVVVLSNTASGLHEEPKAHLDAAGIPLLQGIRPGLKALEKWLDYGERIRNPLSAKDLYAARTTHPSPSWLRDFPKGVLTEVQTKEILRKFGVPCPEEYLCTSLEECLRRAQELGFPVVLKVMSPEVPHKTEAGAVALGIRSADQLKEAYHRILKNVQQYNPTARIDGVLCQRMIEQAIAECFCGVLMDPSFGPAVVFGLGGIWVEVLKNRSIGIPPISFDKAMELIQTTLAYPLLNGFRGKPRGDLESLARMICQVGDLACALGPALQALDMNPILVLPEGQGVYIADALMEVRSERNTLWQ